jgi:lipoprotein NlpI
MATMRFSATPLSATRFSAAVISAALLAVAAGPVLAADQRDLGDNRGIAFAKGERAFVGPIAATIETVRLDPKGPDAQYNRGAREQGKSDLNQIIVYYSGAIRRDPKDDDAYFHRGLAKFYAGALPQAAADLSQASKLDPEYAYYALWIDIIDKRGNGESRLPQAIPHIDMTKWPAPVIRLFLGETTPAAVLAAAADPDAKTRRGQVCEANFYSGEMALQQGAKAEAARLFRLAAADCPREFVEGHAAVSELDALGGSQ